MNDSEVQKIICELNNRYCVVNSLHLFLKMVRGLKYGKVRLIPRYSSFFRIIFISTWSSLIVQLNALLSQGRNDKYSLINTAKNLLSEDFYLEILEIKTKHQETICMLEPWRHNIAHMHTEALDPKELTICINKLDKLLNDIKIWLDKVSKKSINQIYSDSLGEVKHSEVVMRDLLLLTDMNPKDYSKFIGEHLD